MADLIEKSCDCFGLDENQLSLLMKGCFCWRSLEGVKHDDVTWQLVELYGFVELRHVRSAHPITNSGSLSCLFS